MFLAAMGALAIFAPAGRLLHHALDLMHRKPLTIDAGQGEQMNRQGERVVSTPKAFALRPSTKGMDKRRRK